MSFSKFSNLETKNVIHFKLSYLGDKGRTTISNKRNFENKALEIGLRT